MANELFVDFTDCNTKKLVLGDISGVYDPDDNPGGWGAPNNVVGDTTSATMDIRFSNGVEKTNINLIRSPLLFPSTTNQLLTLTDSDIGCPLVDGLAKVTIRLSGNNGLSVTKIFYTYITTTVACCVQKLGAGINVGAECCESKQSESFIKGYNQLTALNYMAKKCCNFTAADVLLKRLQLFCQQNGCSTC